MNAYKAWAALLLIQVIIIIGCVQGPVQDINPDIEKKVESSNSSLLKFKSEKYGFSFSYPGGWEAAAGDLPDRWALLDKNRNTILFMVNRAQSDNLLLLGRSQALRDLYDEEEVSRLKEEDMKNILEIVKLDNFNNRPWYTYGIKFSDKNVHSLVSGTLCGDNEIILVLASNILYFDKSKADYTGILGTFEC